MGASIGRKVMSGHFLVGAMSRLPIMLGAVSVIAMLATTACVIMAASRWMTFRKMGEPGWKAIVPFCDVYTMLGRVWKRDVFWWLVGGEVALVACEAAAFSLPRGSGLRVVAFAVGVVLLCVVGVMYARLARGFGKPTAFGLGLLLFPVVFFPVLGFGRAAWQDDTPAPPAVSTPTAAPSGAA